MSGIKRYNWNGNESSCGHVVLFTDHAAEIARLRAELEKVRGYEVAPLEAKVAELRAEADALRVENEFLRQMVRDSNHNQDFDFKAAMGADV